jgi:glutathione S-transferase
MPKLKLFVAPNSCARVPTIALEEIGVSFETQLVRTLAGEQNTPEFLAVNPKGKVPTLMIDDYPLTENVAILTWLNDTYPEANLMPKPIDSFERILQIADLSYFSATVHPNVTRISMPMKLMEDKELALKNVRPYAIKDMHKITRMIEARLEKGPWWYGNTWSAVDGYLYWVCSRIVSGGFPLNEYANLTRHFDASNERPAVQRAMAREAVNIEILKSEGLIKTPV